MLVASATGGGRRPGEMPGVARTAARLAEAAESARHALGLKLRRVFFPETAVASSWVFSVQWRLTSKLVAPKNNDSCRATQGDTVART